MFDWGQHLYVDNYGEGLSQYLCWNFIFHVEQRDRPPVAEINSVALLVQKPDVPSTHGSREAPKHSSRTSVWSDPSKSQKRW